MARFITRLFLLRTLVLSLVVFVLVRPAYSQVLSIDDTTTPQTPGVGHDYIKMLGETVNPANGSVSLRIDLPTPKGRGLNMPFAILYSSGGVQHVIGWQNGGGIWGTDTGQSSGSGWSYSVPTLTAVQGITADYHPGPPPVTYYCYYSYSYIMRDWSGAAHPLSPMEAAQNPNDGNSGCSLSSNQPSSILTGRDDFFQGITTVPANPYVPNPVTVAGPDGTVYHFSPASNVLNANNVESFWATANSIEDRNGNLVTTSFSGGLNGVASGSIGDSLGRQVVTVSGLASNTNTVSVSGQSAPYTQHWTSVPVNFSVSFTGTDSPPCTISIAPDQSSNYVVQTLTLPNGKFFQFYYDSAYGLLNKIVYPTGGYIKYTWGLNPQSEYIVLPGPPNNGGGQNPNLCYGKYDYPAVTQRTVSYDGVTVAERQTFIYSTSWPNNNSGWTSKQTTVTTYDDVRGTNFLTTHSYVAAFLPPSAWVPVESNIVYKDFNGAVLKTVTKAWIDTFLLGCQLETLDNGSTSGAWYFYGPGGQMTDKKEYDYGLIGSTPCQPGNTGTVSPPPSGVTATRETVTAYQSFANTPIFPTAPSILGSPSSVITYGGGSRVAESDFAYDQAALASVTATGHDDTNYGSVFNIRGNLTTKTQKCFVGATACTDAVTKYTYDQTGQVLSVIDPCGNTPCSDMTGTSHTTAYSYTDNYASGFGTPPGNTNAYVTTITRPTVNGVTAHEYFQYAYSDGQPTASQNDNQKNASKSNAYSYTDSLRRLTQTDYADGGRVTISYNDTAPSPSATRTTLIDGAAGASLATKTILDGLGHVVQTLVTSDPEGTDTTDTTYDGLGLVRTQSNPHRASALPTDGTTGYVYDAIGRLKSVSQSDGSSANTNYSGNCTTTTDETLKARKTCSDAFGRITAVWEDPGTAPHLNYETDYQYDGRGNLICAVQKATDTSAFTSCASAPATWRPRSFQYDSLSRLLSATNPELGAVSLPGSGTITHTYDTNGNVATKTAPKPNTIPVQGALTVTTTYAYDTLNRLTQKSYNDGTTPSAKFGYDGVALSGCTTTPPALSDANPKGKRTSMCDASGATSWSHDLMGRTFTENRSLVGSSTVTKNTGYAYNLDGSLASLTYPSGRTVNYKYSPQGSSNSAGRAIAASDSTPNNYVTSAIYAPFGGLTGTYNGVVAGGFTGIITTNWYNQRLQPCRLSARTVGAAPAQCGDSANIGNVLDFTYDFHAGNGDNGNVFQITNSRDSSRTQLFTYDALNRITTAATQGITGANCWGQMFGHMNGGNFVSGIDAWGNLTEITNTQCSTTTLSQAVNAQNQFSGFCYDLAGNLLSQAGSCPSQLPYNPVYVYEAENRLRSINQTLTPYYTYDGDGKRVIKTYLVNRLYWTGTGSETLEETDASGAATADYVYFNGKRVARVDLPGGSVYYYFSNHLGSASVISNNIGVIKNESDYYPYGGERVITSGDTNRYKFTGKERDSESGLDNFDFRYFGSSLGRFMQPDDDSAQSPLDPQSWNLYSYVQNNPLNRVDPDGHDCVYTSNQTSQSVTVTVERGACSDVNNGTYISGTIDTNSLKYNGQTGDLSYSFQDSSGENGGVGVIALNAPPPPGQLSSDQAQILSQAGAMGMAGVKWGAIEMGQQALGIGLGRLAAAGVEAVMAGRAAKAAEEAIDINNLSNKITRQMTSRGWTKQEILDTVREGDAYAVTNKATGGPATEYVSRSTGKFVVIDNNSGQVLQVSRGDMAPNHWVK